MSLISQHKEYRLAIHQTFQLKSENSQFFFNVYYFFNINSLIIFFFFNQIVKIIVEDKIFIIHFFDVHFTYIHNHQGQHFQTNELLQIC